MYKSWCGSRSKPSLTWGKSESSCLQSFGICLSWATGKWVAMNCQSALDLPKPSSRAGIHSEVDQVLHPRFVMTEVAELARQSHDPKRFPDSQTIPSSTSLRHPKGLWTIVHTWMPISCRFRHFLQCRNLVWESSIESVWTGFKKSLTVTKLPY